MMTLSISLSRTGVWTGPVDALVIYSPAALWRYGWRPPLLSPLGCRIPFILPSTNFNSLAFPLRGVCEGGPILGLNRLLAAGANHCSPRAL